MKFGESARKNRMAGRKGALRENAAAPALEIIDLRSFVNAVNAMPGD
mgnify:CR=1 FL=1